MFYLGIALFVFLFFAVLIGLGLTWLFSPRNMSIPEHLGTIKKVEGANLDKNRALFFGAGLFLSLIITTLTIEAVSREVMEIKEAVKMALIEEEILDIPITEMPPPPPPKVIIAPVIKEVKEEPKEEIKVELDPEEEEPEEVDYDVPDFEPEKEVVDVILDPSEVSKLPEFPGGMAAFYEFINKNFVVSSRDIAEENKGTIYVQFIVNKNGSIDEPKIIRGVSEGLDKEALRVMKVSPKWSPGRDSNGAPAKVRYQVPIRIK